MGFKNLRVIFSTWDRIIEKSFIKCLGCFVSCTLGTRENWIVFLFFLQHTSNFFWRLVENYYILNADWAHRLCFLFYHLLLNNWCWLIMQREPNKELHIHQVVRMITLKLFLHFSQSWRVNRLSSCINVVCIKTFYHVRFILFLKRNFLHCRPRW